MHLADALPPTPLVVAACARLTQGWAGTGAAPRLEEAWALDPRAEASDADAQLAADLLTAAAHPAAHQGDPSHARRAAASLVASLARTLDVPLDDAASLLADRLRERVPYPF